MPVEATVTSSSSARPVFVSPASSPPVRRSSRRIRLLEAVHRNSPTLIFKPVRHSPVGRSNAQRGFVGCLLRSVVASCSVVLSSSAAYRDDPSAARRLLHRPPSWPLRIVLSCGCCLAATARRRLPSCGGLPSPSLPLVGTNWRLGEEMRVVAERHLLLHARGHLSYAHKVDFEGAHARGCCR